MTEASRMTDVYHGINDRGYIKGGEGGNMDMPVLLLPAFEATWLTACTICQRGADTIKSCQTQTEIDFLCTLRENVPQSSHTHIQPSSSLSFPPISVCVPKNVTFCGCRCRVAWLEEFAVRTFRAAP